MEEVDNSKVVNENENNVKIRLFQMRRQNSRTQVAPETVGMRCELFVNCLREKA